MKGRNSGRTKTERKNGSSQECRELPGQVVLVLQGGGALGAYQVGVYEALHEAGIEPDWVIGTSIGAINAAMIAGNPPERRMARLGEFWATVQGDMPRANGFAGLGFGNLLANVVTVTRGIPEFFSPNSAAWLGPQADVGVERAAYYSTAPLRQTLSAMVDFDYLNRCSTRLTVGAVNVKNSEMRYFDSRDEPLRVDHIMASGALPPAFPAVAIAGEWYWDGGIYSNTPIEAVLNDNPRRNSLIFVATVWQPVGEAPRSIAQAMSRQKDVQYASRAASHIDKQKQIHHLRHVIRELASKLPPSKQADPVIRKLAAWGCATTMHVVRLLAPRLEGEDHTKDIDFTAEGLRARRQAGYDDTRVMLERAPWEAACDPLQGVIEHIAAERRRNPP